MKRVGLVLHPARAEAVAAARALAERVAAKGVDVFAAEADAARIGAASVLAGLSLPDDLDLVFVLGGDGTLLRAAETVGRTGVPLLGVNLGHLGFLTEVEGADLDDGLSRVLEEGFTVEERMVLVGEVRDGAATIPLWAMNDVIVEKVEIGRAVKLAVSIDGEPLTTWAADGVIVATATGSTAYSLSAGGPIVSPEVECIVVTPVAPHGLFDRSVVVPATGEVVVDVLPDADAAALSADGAPAVPVAPGARIRLAAGPWPIRLAKLAPAPFWRLVRRKLHLGPNEG